MNLFDPLPLLISVLYIGWSELQYHTIPYLPFLIIILYIGWSGVTGTTRKADGAAYHGKELPTDTAFKIFTTICWSMLGITDRGSKEI